LGGADGSGQVGTFAEVAHEFAPGFRPVGPGVGVQGWVDEGHDSVANEDHGGEVLCAGGVRDEHTC